MHSKGTRRLPAIIASAVVVSALAVGAASASASTFEATGGTGTVKGVGIIKQEELKLWPMTITCLKANTKATVPSGQFASYAEEVKLTSCTAFAGGVKVIVGPEHVEYSAEGIETITEPFNVTPSLLKCHYTVEPQVSAEKALVFGDELYFGNSKFPNGQQKLDLYTTMKNVAYTAVGWPCTGPKENTEFKEAKETEETGEAGTITAGVRDENFAGNLTWVK